MAQRQPVGHADEPGDVLGGRLLEDVFGGTDLLEAAGAHDRHPIGEGERLALVVRDEHGAVAEAGVQLVQLGAHLIAQAGVEVAERLVEEHDIRTSDETTGEGDALLLTTAQLGGIAIEQGGAVDEGCCLLDPAQGP